MRSIRTGWIRGVGAVVLVGGLMITGWSLGVTSAAAPESNPLQAILNKLEQVLAAIGGIQEGNHTLRWDTKNPSASRFVVLAAFANAAVLDKNTGLVWEQAPTATQKDWRQAREDCLERTVGGTKGWRLPSVVELNSVQDPSLAAPFVPATVFTGVLPLSYWSESSYLGAPGFTWVVSFQVNGVAPVDPGRTDFQVWCVRGPMQESAY